MHRMYMYESELAKFIHGHVAIDRYTRSCSCTNKCHTHIPELCCFQKFQQKVDEHQHRCRHCHLTIGILTLAMSCVFVWYVMDIIYIDRSPSAAESANTRPSNWLVRSKQGHSGSRWPKNWAPTVCPKTTPLQCCRSDAIPTASAAMQ